MPYNVSNTFAISGNRLLHKMTSCKNYDLRVDMEDFDGKTRLASYSQFAVGCEDGSFRLAAGGYSGTAG